LISVIMPVRNGGPFLEEAIRSVLLQSFQDFELIVVDDESADHSEVVIESFARQDDRIKLLKNDKTRGAAGARNMGIACAKGLYLAVHDADDVSRPDRLQLQLETLRRRHDLVMLGSFIEMITAGGDRIKVHHEPLGPARIRFHLQVGTPFAHSAVMVRAACLPQAGEIYRYNVAGDYDLWARLLGPGAPADNIPEPLVRYRIHPDQISSKQGSEQSRHADQIARRCLAHLTGRPPSEVHCMPAFRQLVHSVLTGNHTDCEVTLPLMNNFIELIDLCLRHGSFSSFESHGLRNALDAFVSGRSIIRVDGASVAKVSL
jgi:glycosyltransferase involved in cell wall biosynthesis